MQGMVEEPREAPAHPTRRWHMPRWSRVLGGVLVILAIWFWAHMGFTVWSGLQDDRRPADAAVVLGTQVHRSGVPSRRLRSRLDRAVEIYEQDLVKVVIVSGGLGREGHYEAEVMRNYLIDHGVDAEAIVVDNEGYDTYSTARNTKAVLDAQGLRSVIAVSHYYHIARIKLAMARFGVDEVAAAPVGQFPESRDWFSLFREFFAFYFYVLRPFSSSGS